MNLLYRVSVISPCLAKLYIALANTQVRSLPIQLGDGLPFCYLVSAMLSSLVPTRCIQGSAWMHLSQ